MKNIHYIASMETLLPAYDAFVLDLWGVVHDGKVLYPGTLDALKALRKAGKKIVFLSNAPRRASVVAEALASMGVGEGLYDGIVTSGETAYSCLEHPERSPFRPRGHKYLYIGLERDRAILSGLHYEEVMRPEHAQFVLLSHSFEDNQPLETLRPLLQDCARYSLPMVCINPDMEVVRLTGERVYCAGTLAREYHLMGGHVMYFGKPHSKVYDQCMQYLRGINRSRIVAVGDTLVTDIKGGEQNQLSTVLVTGGVLRATVGEPTSPAYQQKCNDIIEKEEIFPDYVLPTLRLG